jgi:hypothetical protein
MPVVSYDGYISAHYPMGANVNVSFKTHSLCHVKNGIFVGFRNESKLGCGYGTPVSVDHALSGSGKPRKVEFFVFVNFK